MIETLCPKQEDESIDQYLIRLGNLKESKQINLTWDEIAIIMNSASQSDHLLTESYWRKRYHKLTENIEIKQIDKQQDKIDASIKTLFTDIEKERIRLQDERYGYNRLLYAQARKENIYDLFRKEIKKYQQVKPLNEQNMKKVSNIACYALLSDIHFGLTFNSFYGIYNTEVARKRVIEYAKHIIDIGHNCDTCYVSLMGDMISGNIHQTLRIENRENLIQQVIGVSELVSEFLYILSTHFEHVIVNNVDGNHSRVDAKIELSFISERLDSLIPWYCKAKLSNLKQVEFVNNILDSSIATFDIFGKLYVSVHGDLDKDLRITVNNISKSLDDHIDYMLAAHTHVPEIRIEDTAFIRNGCVCGSGDEYTIKKRLFSPPSQVCMLCSENGVESIHPILL